MSWEKLLRTVNIKQHGAFIL